jgi:hypothetical protein
MSDCRYVESSRKYHSEPPKIIQSRGSSSDSRSSHDSRGSDQRQYTSSRTSMGYFGGSHSKVVEESKERRHRAPDAGTYISITRIRRTTYKPADNKCISSTSRGSVDVIHQEKRRCDPHEPRASDATSTHYKDTAHRSSRHSSSHKHSSRR